MTRTAFTARLRQFLFCLFCTGALVVAAQDTTGKPSKPDAAGSTPAFNTTRQASANEEIVTRAVVQLLQRGHYAAKNRPIINDKASQRLFDEYFERLDPNKVYFLADDLEEFSPYRLILDDLLKKGKLKFAFQVYERFLQRVEERIEYARKRVKQDFDFTTKEVMLLDRSKAPWAKDREELDEIWRQRVKNQMLIQKLIRTTAAKEEKPVPKQPPQDAVVETYANYYKLLQGNDTADVMEGFLTTLANVFDPHSSYMNWRHLEDFNIDMSLQLQGIGAVLTTDDGHTKIVRIVPGGPADKDGRLKPGYRIIAVGQEDKEAVNVMNMPLNRVVRLIRGKKGTVVRLTILRTLEGIPEEIAITRDKVKLKDSAAHATVKTVKRPDGKTVKVGHIHIPSFYADWKAIRSGDPNARSLTKDVKKLVENMQQQGIVALVIDLRGNGGGSLDESISLAGLFIRQGPVVQVQHAAAAPIIRRDEDGGFAFDLPLVVMTDRTSASASEIFAGAMQDYNRALLVGDQTTHGKGTVQTVLRLHKFDAMRDLKPGALKYTMAKFYRVSGHSTQRKGVAPDIVFPSFFDHMEIGEALLDNALPWDEIKALKIDRTLASVAPYVPRLKANSAARVAKDEKMQFLFNEIKRYGKRRETKTITLNQAKREKLRKEDEYWAKRTSEVLSRGPQAEDNGDKDNGEEKKKKTPDLYLEETLQIAGDLAEMMDADKNLD